MSAVLVEFEPGGFMLSGVPGWEGFRFQRVEVALVAGRAEVTSIEVRRSPRTPADDAVLTPERLAQVPLRQIAQLIASRPAVIAKAAGAGDLAARKFEQALDELNLSSVPARPRGGSDEFSEAVARVVRGARAHRRNVAEAVGTTFRVSIPRANEYIREARDRGALAPGRK